MKKVHSVFFVERHGNQALGYSEVASRLAAAGASFELVRAVETSEREYEVGHLLFRGQVTSTSQVLIRHQTLVLAGLAVVHGIFPAMPTNPILASGDLETGVAIRLQSGDRNQEMVARQGTSEFPGLQGLDVGVGIASHSSADVLCTSCRNVVFSEGVEDNLAPTAFAFDMAVIPVPPQYVPPLTPDPAPVFFSPPPLQPEAPKAIPKAPDPTAEQQHEKSMQTIKSMFSMF